MVKGFVLLYSAVFVVSCNPFDCWCQAAHIEKRSTATTGTRLLSNIDYVGHGYDIYTGNPNDPQANGLDKGFKAKAIFNISYHLDKYTKDHKFLQPDYVDLQPLDTTASYKTATIRDESEYRRVLDDSVTVGVSTPPGARFSANADYKTVHDVTATHEMQYYSVSVNCLSYSATLETSPDTSKLSKDFRDYVAELPFDGVSSEAYKGFIQKFGTHFVKTFKMGGRYGRRYALPTQTVADMMRTITKGSHMTTVAEAVFRSAVRSEGTTSNIVSPTQIQTFKDKTVVTGIFYVGETPDPPPKFDISSWCNTVKSNPQPVIYDFGDVSSLLTSERFHDDPHISTKKTRLEEAVLAYCDSLNISYCRSSSPNPPKQMKVVHYNKYSRQLCHNTFYVPKLDSLDDRVIGVLASCTFGDFGPSQYTIAIDSSAASPEVIQKAIGWNLTFNSPDTSAHTAFFRPQCAPGFASVSDFAVKCGMPLGCDVTGDPSQDCSHSDAKTWINALSEKNALPCISTRCLGQCTPSHCNDDLDHGDNVVEGITDGIGKFGANKEVYSGSFFRYGNRFELGLDLFRCLTTVCLEGY